MKGNQRIALTKRLLQEALLGLMERKALDKINVTELCAKAGINRATFYRHYHIPRDVLMEMQTEFAEHIQASFDMDTPVKDPARYIEAVCTYLYENADLVKVFIQNNSHEDITGLFDDFFRRLLCEDHSVKRSLSLDQTEIRLISAYMAGGGYFMLRRWLLDDIENPPKEIAKLFLSFVEPEQTT